MEISIATAASLEVEQDERLIRPVWWHIIPLILVTYLVSAIVLFSTALAIRITGAIAPVNRSAS